MLFYYIIFYSEADQTLHLFCESYFEVSLLLTIILLRSKFTPYYHFDSCSPKRIYFIMEVLFGKSVNIFSSITIIILSLGLKTKLPSCSVEIGSYQVFPLFQLSILFTDVAYKY